MKINNIKILLLSLLAMVCVCSCNKDESPFSGGDNYISSFRLAQGNITLNAAISNGSMVLTAPENFSLEGATATVAISENASIAPDPASITHWDDEQTFVVTAHNGTQNTYTYSVERTVVSKDGSMTLLTQADVEALAALNVSQISGSLIIGAATGADSVYSLAPLTSLKTIVNGIFINATYAGESLVGLENLEKIGGLQITKNKKLKTVELPKLTSVMSDLILNTASVKVLRFPELVNIDKTFSVTMSDSITVMELPKLETIIENLTLTGRPLPKLTAIDFPALKKVGGTISISGWREVETVNMPLLTGTTTAITVRSMAKMTSLTVPQLQSVLYAVTVSDNALMTTLDFSSLQSVGRDFSTTNVALENLDGLKSLSTVGNDLILTSLPKLKSMQGLKALESVGQTVNLWNWPALEDETLSGLSGLKSVGGNIVFSRVPFKKFSGFTFKVAGTLSIAASDVLSIDEIDVRNMDIKGLQLQDISTPVVLRGDAVFKGTLRLYNAMPAEMEGFEEVNELRYEQVTADRPLNIRKVNGNMTVSGTSLEVLRMPLLEEVVGTFTLTCSQRPTMTIDLPALKTIGAAVTIESLSTTSMTVLSLPALQSINGDCTFSAYYFTDIQMPSLTTINGRLNLGTWNTEMTHLNGFSALTSVQGIYVQGYEKLTDFTGLKNALSSFTAADWRVSGNSYNPTYQDMLDGKYVKP